MLEAAATAAAANRGALPPACAPLPALVHTPRATRAVRRVTSCAYQKKMYPTPSVADGTLDARRRVSCSAAALAVCAPSGEGRRTSR